MMWVVGAILRALDTTLGRVTAGVILVLGVLAMVDTRARRQAKKQADQKHTEQAQRTFDATSKAIRDADVSRGDLDDDLRWLRARAKARQR